MELLITIHNAKKVTFDGRDCFIVSLLDKEGRLLFNRESKRYDSEATSEHSNFDEALGHAKDLAKRRGAVRITHLVKYREYINYGP
jgi:hypothetical protein